VAKGRRTPFRVIPAIDLKDGKCVTLVGGDPQRRIAELEDPLEVAKEWESAGASLLHVIDLDGALGGQPTNLDTVRVINDSLTIPVQFGGGIRSYETARSLLASGIARIILGTLALRELQVVEALSQEFGPSRIMVALDFKGDKVVTHGWRSLSSFDPLSAAREFQSRGAGSLLLTNVEVEGKLQGLPLEPIGRIASAVEIDVIASGGVSSIDDIISVRAAGAAGVIVGAAIYTGRINLREAIRRAER